MRQQLRRRAGFSLLSAIFILVVLGAAGAVMVRMSGVQQATTNFALLGARAYHAARSGLEWGIWHALDSSACPADTSFVLNEGGLDGLSVSVSCTSSSHDEGPDTRNIFQIVSIAAYGSFGSADYAQRRLQATVTDGS